MASVEPQQPSGPSIYERLGLHPANPGRVVRPARTRGPDRTEPWRIVAAFALLLALTAIGYGFGTYATDQMQRRLDADQAEILALDRRVQTLEARARQQTPQKPVTAPGP